MFARRRYSILAAVVALVLTILFLNAYNGSGKYTSSWPPFFADSSSTRPTLPQSETSYFPPPNEESLDVFPSPPSTPFFPPLRSPWRNVTIRHPVSDLISLPSGHPKQLPRIQHQFQPEAAAERTIRLGRKAAIKKAFARCYTSYRTSAWMKDELTPISGKGRNAFGGWSATLVDSLDTLFLMGMHVEFAEAVDSASRIDFSESTDDIVNMFETTIRFLGGFLGAYDLTGDETLIRKAVEVGEMLLLAFDTPNHMPVARWSFTIAANGQDEEQEASPVTSAAEIGSYTLEFIRLSQITGDPRWYDAVARISNTFASQQHATNLPGMWPMTVNARDLNFTADSWFTLGAMSDSLYEYFPKAFALLGGLEPVYETLYQGSMATSIRHLFFRPMTPDGQDVLISGNMRADLHPPQHTLEPQGQHLGCFAGGMLALGGRLFDMPEHVSVGRRLTDGCIWAYNASKWGVMPETFFLVPCDSANGTAACPWDQKKWEAAVLERYNGEKEGRDARSVIANKRLAPGFTDIADGRYILRPEAIESVFILYRITGDKALQDAAWRMWTSISNLTETKYANAAVADVTADKPRLDDRMESFWLAETLKYFYLIFSEPELVSLDEFVLNTEAHPFRRPKKRMLD